MIGDIVSGELDWADVAFLVAAVLFVVAAVFEYRAGTLDHGRPGAGILSALGLACTALGLLLL